MGFSEEWNVLSQRVAEKLREIKDREKTLVLLEEEEMVDSALKEKEFREREAELGRKEALLESQKKEREDWEKFLEEKLKELDLKEDCIKEREKKVKKREKELELREKRLEEESVDAIRSRQPAKGVIQDGREVEGGEIQCCSGSDLNLEAQDQEEVDEKDISSTNPMAFILAHMDGKSLLSFLHSHFDDHELLRDEVSIVLRISDD